MSPSNIVQGTILGENDVVMRGIIRSVLQHTTLQIFQAADGTEAVALAQRFVARLVLLDIGMPKLDGLQACRIIRALPGYAQVPIVMLTGYDDPRMRQAARAVGANDFITKPVRPDVLLRRLAGHLDQHAAAPPEPASVAGEAAPLQQGRETVKIWRSLDGGS